MSEVTEKLYRAYKNSDYSYGDIAKLTGVSKSACQRYITGEIENIPIDAFKKICGVLELVPEVVLGWVEPETAEVEEPVAPVVGIYNQLNSKGKTEYVRYGKYLVSQDEYRADEEEAPQSEIRYIRHYLTAAAAGYAAPIEGSDYEMVPADEKTPANADFSIDITGDSMEPYIHDGERVYVSRDTSGLKEFDVGIFFVDGDVYCKQWCVDFIGTLHLLSANPNREDANIQVRRESSRNVVCFGKVILPKKLPQPEYI